MIAMFVRDQCALELRRLHTDPAQPFTQHIAAQARVDQKFCAPLWTGLDQQSIAATTTT